MKLTNHLCPECGFRLDPDNPSEPVCPACGADPNDERWLGRDIGLATVIEDAAAFAETVRSGNDVLGPELSAEPDVAYAPDPDVDFVIGDAEALMRALMDGPVLVAGNGLIN
jgi:hypothetical protein